jgi:hypothetical protein
MAREIDKLIEAKSKGLDTYPFSIEKNQVLLTVKDDEDFSEDFIFILCRYKVNEKTGKTYSVEDLSKFAWCEALDNTCSIALAKSRISEQERKDKLAIALLNSLKA